MTCNVPPYYDKIPFQIGYVVSLDQLYEYSLNQDLNSEHNKFYGSITNFLRTIFVLETQMVTMV